MPDPHRPHKPISWECKACADPVWAYIERLEARIAELEDALQTDMEHCQGCRKIKELEDQVAILVMESSMRLKRIVDLEQDGQNDMAEIDCLKARIRELEGWQ
jgi:chromosome segregation ATPase